MIFDDFVALTQNVVDELPSTMIDALDNVAIVPEEGKVDGPLGEYFGVPRPERHGETTGSIPDKIAVYFLSILDACGDDPVAVKEEIRRTLWHEIGHHVGWDDDVLEHAEIRRGWRTQE